MKLTKITGPVPSGLTYTQKDFKNGSIVKWCPGCGDYAILNSIHKAMAEIGIAPHNTVVVSGIGCSSRLPYYMNTYGMHTIHGRGAAIATGVKVANPNLSVWLVSGDGDSMAIGGNHFIHMIRRNVNINMMLINNKIYGLTKGQYSPTSDRGFISKSSPMGTVEDPFIPAELVFGARGTFFARTIDIDMQMTQDILVQAAAHKGASIVEGLVNCMIFNNGTHKQYTDREIRADATITLRHGERMIYGKERNKGLILDGLELKSVTIGENGITEEDILIHDASTKSPVLHSMLGMMHVVNPELPVALGVIRRVEGLTYDEEVTNQVITAQEKKPNLTLQSYLDSLSSWEVK